jgi:FMN phosphatase YigB (HAD superfamily)
MSNDLEYWLNLISFDVPNQHNNKFGFKIAVFDLDMTLWDQRQLFKDIKEILHALQQSNISMYVASFHTEALMCCKALGIDHYFDDVVYGRTQTKSEMIHMILKRHPYASKQEIVFFDDNIENIYDVKRKLGIRTILVNEKGLTWQHIPRITPIM